MSNKLRQEWACANGKSDAVPDIRDLIQFAEERHSLLDDTSTYSRPLVPYRQPYPTQKPSKPYNSQHKTPRANLLPIRAATPTCPVCEEEHPVYYCSQFKSWDVDRRKGMIKENIYVTTVWLQDTKLQPAQAGSPAGPVVASTTP